MHLLAYKLLEDCNKRLKTDKWNVAEGEMFYNSSTFLQFGQYEDLNMNT